MTIAVTFGLILWQKRPKKYSKNLDTLLFNQHGWHIKILRTDNGLEFKNSLFETYCHDNGILHQFTVPYSPQQNGVAERLNQTLINSVRSMLKYSKLEYSLLAEPLLCATNIRNRSPSAALKDQKTPYELFTNKVPSVSHFKIFGEIGCAVNNASHNKLQHKADPLMDTHLTHQNIAFSPDRSRIVIARDVFCPHPSSSPLQQAQPKSKIG